MTRSVIVLANDLLDGPQDEAVTQAFPDIGYVWNAREAVDVAVSGDAALLLAPGLDTFKCAQATLLAAALGVRLLTLRVSPRVPGEWVVKPLGLGV